MPHEAIKSFTTITTLWMLDNILLIVVVIVVVIKSLGLGSRVLTNYTQSIDFISV